LLREGEVIVDALLGTGLKGEVRPSSRSHFQINSAGRPIFALDVPSGLDSDTGVTARRDGPARLSVTFVGHETGIHRNGPGVPGTVFFDDLEIVAPQLGV